MKLFLLLVVLASFSNCFSQYAKASDSLSISTSKNSDCLCFSSIILNKITSYNCKQNKMKDTNSFYSLYRYNHDSRKDNNRESFITNIDCISIMNRSEFLRYMTCEKIDRLSFQHKGDCTPICVEDTDYFDTKQQLLSSPIRYQNEIPDESYRYSIILQIIIQDEYNNRIEYGIDLKNEYSMIKLILKSSLKKEDYEKIIDFINNNNIYKQDY